MLLMCSHQSTDSQNFKQADFLKTNWM